MNKVVDVYDALSKTYETTYVKSDDALTYLKDEADAAKHWRASGLSGNIISLGCGSGQDVEVLDFPDCWTGYDISRGMIANGEYKFPTYNFIEHDCNIMIDSQADVLACLFGAGNYLGVDKLLEHYNNLGCHGAFFVFYGEHYEDGIINDYHHYSMSYLESAFAQYKPNVNKLTEDSNYYVVWWNEG
jgi:predicted TPR repeat methyltransferase